MVPAGLAENMRISVGLPLPLKGPKARFGKMHYQSYLMALGEINVSRGKAFAVALSDTDKMTVFGPVKFVS
jgi:hypothetical protein